MVTYDFCQHPPFTDGNGPIARLLTNLALLQANYSFLIFPPVVRADYINSIREAQTNGKQEMFLNFLSEMVLESMKDYLSLLKV